MSKLLFLRKGAEIKKSIKLTVYVFQFDFSAKYYGRYFSLFLRLIQPNIRALYLSLVLAGSRIVKQTCQRDKLQHFLFLLLEK